MCRVSPVGAAAPAVAVGGLQEGAPPGLSANRAAHSRARPARRRRVPRGDAPDAPAEEEHDNDEQPAEHKLVPLAEALDELVEDDVSGRPNRGPHQRSDAAEDRHHDE